MTGQENKKFQVGDKVISITDTPQVPEGFIGYIVQNGNTFGYAVRGEHSVATEYFEERELELLSVAQQSVKADQPEYTGGSSNYYKVFVNNPTTLDAPYEAECNDIIEALKMTFAEGNAFKAIWRKAKARQGVQKKGYDNGLYDSEKVVFFGERMVVEAKQ